MINDIKIINDYNILQNAKIIVYGTGKRGKKLVSLLELIEANILGYCDSDIKKKGNIIDNYIVYHINDIQQLIDKNIIIIVASVYFEEIIHSLLQYNLESNIFTYFAAEISIYFNYNKFSIKNKKTSNIYFKNMINECCKENILENKSDILECLLDINNQNVLIYQVGKVGSTTLADTIQSYGINTSHCHSLFSLPLINENKKLNIYRKKIIANFAGKIIIPVREPISRDISQYFQLLQARLGVLCQEYKIDNLIDGFVKIYYDSLIQKTSYNENTGLQAILLNNSSKGILFDWFDYELKNFLGVDILTEPFNTKTGYQIYKKNNCEILILQLEKMNILEDIIGNFLSVPNFKLQSSNTYKQKEYKYLYKNFKEQLVLPKEYIDFYYKSNPWFAHFYSIEQREEFYSKWMNICKL